MSKVSMMSLLVTFCSLQLAVQAPDKRLHPYPIVAETDPPAKVFDTPTNMAALRFRSDNFIEKFDNFRARFCSYCR